MTEPACPHCDCRLRPELVREDARGQLWLCDGCSKTWSIADSSAPPSLGTSRTPRGETVRAGDQRD